MLLQFDNTRVSSIGAASRGGTRFQECYDYATHTQDGRVLKRRPGGDACLANG